MQGQQGGIAHQHAINANLPAEFEDPGGLAQFPLAQVDVQGEVRLGAARVDGANRVGQFLLAEVPGTASGMERGQPEVNRRGPGLQGRIKRFPVPGRGQQLQLSGRRLPSICVTHETAPMQQKPTP